MNKPTDYTSMLIYEVYKLKMQQRKLFEAQANIAIQQMKIKDLTELRERSI